MLASVPGTLAGLMLVLPATGHLQLMATPFMAMAERLDPQADEDQVWDTAFSCLILLWTLLVGGCLTCLGVAGFRWWRRSGSV